MRDLFYFRTIMNVPFFLNISGGEMFVILLFVLIFFGSKSLPELARTLGRGMREIKDATDNIKQEITGSVRDVEREVYENRQKFTKELDDEFKKLDDEISEK